MEAQTLPIAIAFILLTAILCLILIGSKWKWWQKLLLIIIVPSFGLVVWRSIGSYQGWPTADEPPLKSLIFQMVIREPEPARSDQGAIFLWLMSFEDKSASSLNPLDYVSAGREPRAFRFEYSRRMHRGLEKARRSIREGRPPVLDFSGKSQSQGDKDGEQDEEGGEGDDAAGDSGSGSKGYRYEQKRRDFQIYDLPPPHPPEKRND